MSGQGAVGKRCGCRDAASRKRLEQRCPQLAERGHGSWYFDASAADHLGRIRRVRRGGFPSQATARQARDLWVRQTSEACTARSWTVAAWLAYWLSTRTGIRPTTRAQYTRDVDRFLVPHLGAVLLADLDLPRLRAGFAAIAATRNGRGQPQSAACLQHLRTTLRAALNQAVREGILDDNPARRLEVCSYPRPHAQVWTDGRVRDWLNTGTRPAVAVWTATQLAVFLDLVADDALYAMWRLIALRGLRRGEACGLRWSDLDLDRGIAYIVRNRTCVGYQVLEGPPKTTAGRRVIALDRTTIRTLRAHRAAQLAAGHRRQAQGKPWVDSEYLFTQTTGQPIHPGYATQRFHKLTTAAGLPPVRLHDLRHGSASLAHEAGADLKTIQDLLGHSSILVTADIYTSVLPATQRRCADQTARLVQQAAHRTRTKIQAKARRSRRKNRGANRCGQQRPTPLTPDAPRRGHPDRSASAQVNKPTATATPATVTTSNGTHASPTVHRGQRTRGGDQAKRQANGLPMLRARRDSNP
jgi:integrase